MAGTETKNYDPALIAVSIGGALITGFETGTFVTITRNQNNYDFTVGPDGLEGIRTKRNDRSAVLTLTLRQSATANRILSNLANRDEKDGDGVVPISISDAASPDTQFLTGKGWIQKPADAGFGDSPQPRAWAFVLAEVPMVHGGTPAAAALAETIT